MSDNTKYFYLKLQESFFDNEKIRIMESMENGIYYSNLLIKLYLKSLKTNGKLRFTKTIPYNEQMIATITNINIDIVIFGLKILIELQFVEKLDDGTLYMTEIQNFIGKSSTTADRVREYRKKIDEHKLLGSSSKDSVAQQHSEIINTVDNRENAKHHDINAKTDSDQIFKNSDSNTDKYQTQMYENTITNVSQPEKQTYTYPDTNVTTNEDQMYSDAVTNVTKSSNICTPEIELDLDLNIDQNHHRVTECNNVVNTQNKKNIGGDDVGLKNIADIFLKLTGKHPAPTDLQYMKTSLDPPVDITLDHKSREKLVIQTMVQVYKAFKLSNPNSNINSFKYFTQPIVREFENHMANLKGVKKNAGTDLASKDIYVDEYGNTYNFSNFASNRQ